MDIKVVLLAFVLALITPLCSCSRSVEDYLNIGLKYHYEELRWIAKKIDSGQWGDNIDTIASNLKLARQLTLTVRKHSLESIKDRDNLDISSYKGDMFELSEILSDVLSFSYEEPEVLKCHNLEASAFIAIVNLKFGGLKKIQKSLENPPKSLLFQYLQKYGIDHIRECVASMPQRYMEALNKLPSGTESKLDALVSMNKQFAPENHLASWAENLDLARGQFDGRRMSKAAILYMDDVEVDHLKSRGSGKMLASFIFRTCFEMRSAMPFDMYNLAKFITPGSESELNLEQSPRFRKLNEYSRICEPFDNYRTRAKAKANVVSNVFRFGLQSILRMI